MTITDPRRTAGRAQRVEQRRSSRRRTRWLILLAVAVVAAAIVGSVALIDRGSPGSAGPRAVAPNAPTSSTPGSPNHPLGAGRGQWQLLMGDDFNGSTLDSDLWHTCYWWSESGCTNRGNNELEWYLPDNVNVDGGAAHLVARRQAVTGADGLAFPYTSGLLSQAGVDRDLFTFTYGFAEARVRVPTGSGMWSAFWMLPATARVEARGRHLRDRR